MSSKAGGRSCSQSPGQIGERQLTIAAGPVEMQFSDMLKFSAKVPQY